MTTLPSSRVSLADVIEAIRSAPIDARRKQELVSSVRTVAKALGRDPRAVPADAKSLRTALQRIEPAAIGLSLGRWNNVLSHLRAALALVQPLIKSRSCEPISPGWQLLLDQVPTRSDRLRLARLMRWLSTEGIEPSRISVADLDRFSTCLIETSLVKDVARKLRDTGCAWNRQVEANPLWPHVPVPISVDPRRFSFNWASFPPSFREDVDRWVQRMSGADFLDPDAPIRPLQPATIKSRCYDLRAFASALVIVGRKPSDLTSIAACLTLENYSDGLKFFYERSGRKKERRLSDLAANLKAIAKHWVKVGAPVLLEMDKIARRVAVHQNGMTQKNRDRLLPTNDPAVEAKLWGLPDLLKGLAASPKIPDASRRVFAQVAVAVAILLVAPVRIKNLRSIEVGRHLTVSGSKLLLHFPAHEVKNRRDLPFELPDPTASIIRWYLAAFPNHSPGPSYLFSTRDGSCKAIVTLQMQIVRAIKKHTGLAWNTHLFRHFGAKVFLEHNPGEYEVVRSVLGHSSTTTTMNAYTGLETLSAARHFSAQVMRRRNENSREGGTDESNRRDPVHKNRRLASNGPRAVDQRDKKKRPLLKR